MTAQLDPRERHARIPSHYPGLTLFLRHLRPARASGHVVLYVHGATFPSALSIAHRFDGRSWRDELTDAGFDVWGLDFHGYGGSDPFPEMARPPADVPALGRADDASRQIERAVRFILAEHGLTRLSIIAHSWGTIAAGRFAGRCPELVDRLVLFAPVAQRPSEAEAPRLPGWRIVTVQEQWERFTADTPKDEAPVLLERHFRPWAEAWLDSEPASRRRDPVGVKVPLGPVQDIAEAWAGALAYDPAAIRAPTCILRGAWDGLCTDVDARWLFEGLRNADQRRDVKIARAGHLMHLEEARYALYREAETFLLGRDRPASP